MSTQKDNIEDPEFHPKRRFLGRPKKYHSEEDLKASAIKNLRVYRKQKKIPSDEKYFMSEEDRNNLFITLDYLQTQLDIVKDVIKGYTHKIVIKEDDEISPVVTQRVKKTALDYIEGKLSSVHKCTCKEEINE